MTFQGSSGRGFWPAKNSLPVPSHFGLVNACVTCGLDEALYRYTGEAGLGRLCTGKWQISDLQFALILHLDTDSEEQTPPFPVPSERMPLRRMSPFSSTLNLQPSFPGRSYFDFRSSPHQLSLHSSLQSLNAPGELSSSDLSSWSLCLEGISEIPVLFLPFMCVERAMSWSLCLWPASAMRGIWMTELCGILVCVVWGPTVELWSMCNGIGKWWVKLFFLHKLELPWIACSIITCSGIAWHRCWLRWGLSLEVCNTCCIQETSCGWETGSVHPAWSGLIKHRLKRSLLKK